MKATVKENLKKGIRKERSERGRRGEKKEVILNFLNIIYNVFPQIRETKAKMKN